MKARSLIALTSLLYLLSACAATNDQPMWFKELGEPKAADSVDYATVNEQVFRKSCTGCHSSVQPRLDTYDQVTAALRAIEDDVFVKRSMPKNGSLTPSQLAALRKWIDLGAPEFSTPREKPEEPGPTPAPIPNSWAALSEKVVNVSCAGCHFPDNPNGRTDLTTAAGFKASIGSIMYLTLVEKESPMPPIDKPQLTDEQKRILTEWVIANQPEE